MKFILKLICGKNYNAERCQRNKLFNTAADLPKQGCAFLIFLVMFWFGLTFFYGGFTAKEGIQIPAIFFGFIIMLPALYFMFYREGLYIDNKKLFLTRWRQFLFYVRECNYDISQSKIIMLYSKETEHKNQPGMRTTSISYIVAFKDIPEEAWGTYSSYPKAVEEVKLLQSFLKEFEFEDQVTHVKNV